MQLCLPPSPSPEVVRARAAPLARLLAPLGVAIDVAPSYAALGDGLVDGRWPIAWAPPIVCARVEMAGGAVVLRAMRGGSMTYRAGIVCRADAEIDWTKTRDLVAAWVDEDSAAGYLLARSWLAARRVDALHGFKRALFTGSYVTSLQAVADRRADVTSVFISGPSGVLGGPSGVLGGASSVLGGVSGPGPGSHTTLDEIEAALRDKLKIAAITGDTQTDGIALAPGADRVGLAPVLDCLAGLAGSEDGRRALQSVLRCDELRPAPPRPTSLALQNILPPEVRPAPARGPSG